MSGVSAFLRTHAPALGVFTALALVFCAPVLTDPTGLALGHPSNDVWNHVWGFWWVGTELAAGRLPVATDLIAWPAGGSLWFIDTFNVLATLPVLWLAGPTAAYNAAIFANFVLCGVGAYVLALRVARTHAGAALAGVAYMSCPHLLGQAYNGISETLSAGWLPLSIAAFLAAREQPRPAQAALAGLAFGLTAFANWYYGLFAAMVGGAVMAWDLLGVLRARSTRGLPRAATALVIGGATAAIVAGGPFTLFYLSMGAADAVVTRDRAFVWMTLVMHNMTDVVSIFRPGKNYSPDLKAQFDEDLLVIVYLGHALVWPALAMLWTGWRRFTRPWALFAAAFLVLTLGPYLYVAGAYVKLDGSWIALPFVALYDAFPLFSRISHAYRFIIGASLALSVMLAWTVRELGQRGIPVVAAAVWLGALRLVESLWLSPAVFPLPTADTRVPAVYAHLDGGAVLDLPLSLPVLARSHYSMYQMVHGQPMPYGLNDPSPLYLYVNRYSRYLIELERSTVASLPSTLPALDLALGQEDLRTRGMRWIVLHRSEYPAPQYAKVAQFLDLTATPTWDDGETRVYDLGAATP
jgi:hypothetical protein